MNEQEEKNRRYGDSVDDIRLMRQQQDKLADLIGDVVSSLQGDKLGNRGIIPDMAEIRQELSVLKTDVNAIKVEIKEIKFSEKLKARYQKAMYAMAGGIVMAVLQALLKHFLP